MRNDVFRSYRSSLGFSSFIRRPTSALLWIGAALSTLGCAQDHFQSAIHPASPAAQKIAWLWWLMLVVCTAVFVLVLVLLVIAIFKAPRDEESLPPMGRNGFIVVYGLVMTSVVVVALLVASLGATIAIVPTPDMKVIQVVGHQWWWEVRYPDRDVVIANEIYIPVGEPVRLELRAADVIHSFWAPNLNGKMDLLPEMNTYLWLQADKPGVYRCQCAEFCGLQHAKMGLYVIAVSPDEYEEWIADRLSAKQNPASTEAAERGRRIFFDAGCAVCHAIDGTEAVGRSGPDLTHLANRKSLGAATIPNNRGNLGGWIANPQAIKPGNLMPPTFVDSEELDLLLTYLETLK